MEENEVAIEAKPEAIEIKNFLEAMSASGHLSS